MIVQILLGIVIADVLIATFHWLNDTYLPYCNNIPFVSMIAKDNELHHYYPQDILGYSFMKNISVTLPITVVILAFVAVLAPSFTIKYKYFIGTLFVIGVMAQELHKYNHKFLHEHHRLHHEAPDTRYGVVLPITNHVLDGIGFWRFLEYLVQATTGIAPSRKPPYSEYANLRDTEDINILRQNLANIYACAG